MSDAEETVSGEAIPTACPVTLDVPVARPILADDVPIAPPTTDPMLLPLTSRRSALLDVGGLILLLILFDLASGVFLGFALGVDVDSAEAATEADRTAMRRTMLVPTLILRAMGAIAAVTLILRRRRQSFRSVGLGRAGFGVDVLIGVAGVTVLYALILFLMAGVWMLRPQLPDEMRENADRILELVPRLSPIGLAALSVAVGVYEELIFRGFLMTRLRRATQSWPAAVVLSTVVFTSLHAIDQVSIALVAIAVLSLVLSAVTIWRRSLVPAIVAHFLWNLSQFLWLQYQAGSLWK